MQLTDLEQQVLKDFCERYCKYKMRYDPPLPNFSMEGETLEVLKNLQAKGLVQLAQRYNTNSFNQIMSVITGYIPTEKLKSTELYKRIDNFVKFGNRCPRKEK